ncbi:hypothetical protein [Domibacillus iocasae]|uniref:Uncharacterized protein n=1 Tax=Domibacillus iocasae TaxID=1714016 RepID=A0A1E7DQ81_9BACI|nr:hypothetical protein [Domibacillus iocasae]OES45214.1 hypothetical protein BA724_04190 [Domibacillus iocasae]
MNPLSFKKVVPKDRLEHHINKEKIEAPKNSIEEMYFAFVDKKQKLAEAVFREYEFGGQTSLNIFEIIDFPKSLNNKASLIKHLKSKLNIQTKIVGVPLKPPILKEPQIHYIEELDNALLIQWVSGSLKKEWNGYAMAERLDPRYVTTIVRFGSPNFIEVRAGFNTTIQYLKLFRVLLSKEEQPVEMEWIPLTKLTEPEAEKIAEILKAGLLDAEHLGSGGIGKYAVSVGPDDHDLRQVDEYKKQFSGKKYLAQVLLVDYKDIDNGYETKVKFRINMRGGFEFKSKVSEKIIKRIMDVFVEVRYNQKASGE